MTRTQTEMVATARRRRWTGSEKERIVAASFEAGSSASEVARAFGLHVSQLFRWRKQLGPQLGSSLTSDMTLQPFAEANPCDQPARAERKRPTAGLIEITLSGGQKVRVDRDVDVEALRRVLDVLDKR